MMILHANIVGDGRKDLIILHGFLGMGDNWKTHARQWQIMGYRVHLIDQRNHGRSFWNSTFNYSVLAADLDHYINYHQITETLILGHSMGGKTAMHYACQNPHKVKGLIVADIGVKKYPPHHQEILEGLALLHSRTLTSRSQADQILQEKVSHNSIRQFLLKNLYRKTPETLALRLNIDVLKNASEAVGAPLPDTFIYEGPCLVLNGGLSNYILPEDQQGIRQHFPQATFKTIPNAGHWLHAENPKSFLDEVHSWMARL
jgi:esterase